MMITTSPQRTILFDTDKRQYYRLDEMAATVWKLVNRPVTLRELQDALVEHFGLEPEIAERELVSVLEQMQTEGLIEEQATDEVV